MSNTTATIPPAASMPKPGVGLMRIGILLALWLWMFLPSLRIFAETAYSSREWSYALATPLLTLLLLYRRRAILLDSISHESWWGLALLLLGLAGYAMMTWPFSFGYPRDLCIIVTLAGAILAAGGRKLLKHSLPILLLLALSIPISARIFSRLIITPDTMTLRLTQFMLDQLPGVNVILEGPDLRFTTSARTGIIAMGEPHRGASLLQAYLAIGVFIVFVRIRPAWQVLVMCIVALPITLLANWLRILTWGLMTLYTELDLASSIPRITATVGSLTAAYAMFAMILVILGGLLMESEREDIDEAPEAADD